MELKVTIKELSGNEAVLKFEDGQSVTWPVSKLPKDSKIEDVLTISMNDNGSEKEPEQLAKDLLNEILNTD